MPFIGVGITITGPLGASGFASAGTNQRFLIWGSVARGYNAAYAAPGTNPAFKVVDGTGANAQIINVLSTGKTDVASLNSWITAHGTAHVSQLYDQTGGGNHWTQATVAKMPTITVSGIGGFPSLTFASLSAQTLSSTGSLPTQAQPFTFEVVAERTANFTTLQDILSTNVVYQTNNGVGKIELQFDNVANTVDLFAGSGPLLAAANDSAGHVIQTTANNTACTINIDSATQVAGNAGATTPSGTDVLWLGSYGTGTTYMDGLISEVGMYGGAFNAAVHANARSFYGL